MIVANSVQRHSITWRGALTRHVLEIHRHCRAQRIRHAIKKNYLGICIRYVEIINLLFLFSTHFVNEYVGVRRFVYFVRDLFLKR